MRVGVHGPGVRGTFVGHLLIAPDDLERVVIGPQDVLLDRYRVVDEIGHGGSAKVYRAVDTTLDRQVAIKVIDDASEEHVADAQEEARLLAAVRHPNVVAIHDVVEHDGLGIIVMELVEGDDLATYLDEHGPLTTEQVVDVISDVAAALDAAHAAGVIHRDVKPANIVLDSDGRARVTDFGIGRFRGSDEIVGSHIRGSVAYVAPERLTGEPGDHAVDVYALAAVAFELLTGQAPFVGDEPLEVAKAHINDTPPRPSARRLDLPGAVDEAVLRGLAKEPVHRWSTAGAFADALELAFRPAVEPERRGARLLDVLAAACAAAIAALVMVSAASADGPAPELVSEPTIVVTETPGDDPSPAEISTVDPAAEVTTVSDADRGAGTKKPRGEGNCPDHAKCGGK